VTTASTPATVTCAPTIGLTTDAFSATTPPIVAVAAVARPAGRAANDGAATGTPSASAWKERRPPVALADWSASLQTAKCEPVWSV
jgi:hypothetical protein